MPNLAVCCPNCDRIRYEALSPYTGECFNCHHDMSGLLPRRLRHWRSWAEIALHRDNEHQPIFDILNNEMLNISATFSQATPGQPILPIMAPLQTPGSPSAPQRFTFFPKLPIELRNSIWSYALPGPRILRIECRPVPGQSSVFSIYTPTPSPAILYVCQESHIEASKVYQRVFSTPYSKPNTWFNFDHDFIYFEDHDWTLLKSRLIWSWEDLRTVQNIAVLHRNRYRTDLEAPFHDLASFFPKVKIVTIVAKRHDTQMDACGDLTMMEHFDIENSLEMYGDLYSPLNEATHQEAASNYLAHVQRDKVAFLASWEGKRSSDPDETGSPRYQMPLVDFRLVTTKHAKKMLTVARTNYEKLKAEWQSSGKFWIAIQDFEGNQVRVIVEQSSTVRHILGYLCSKDILADGQASLYSDGKRSYPSQTVAQLGLEFGDVADLQGESLRTVSPVNTENP